KVPSPNTSYCWPGFVRKLSSAAIGVDLLSYAAEGVLSASGKRSVGVCFSYTLRPSQSVNLSANDAAKIPALLPRKARCSTATSFKSQAMRRSFARSEWASNPYFLEPIILGGRIIGCGPSARGGEIREVAVRVHARNHQRVARHAVRV